MDYLAAMVLAIVEGFTEFLPSTILGFIFYSVVKNLFLGNAVITLIALLGRRNRVNSIRTDI